MSSLWDIPKEGAPAAYDFSAFIISGNFFSAQHVAKVAAPLLWIFRPEIKFVKFWNLHRSGLTQVFHNIEAT